MPTHTFTQARNIIRDLCRAHDETQSESEGRFPLADAGCIDCTKGTVPDSLNTGLCPYHRARNFLRTAP